MAAGIFPLLLEFASLLRGQMHHGDYNQHGRPSLVLFCLDTFSRGSRVICMLTTRVPRIARLAQSCLGAVGTANARLTRQLSSY